MRIEIEPEKQKRFGIEIDLEDDLPFAQPDLLENSAATVDLEVIREGVNWWIEVKDYDGAKTTATSPARARSEGGPALEIPSKVLARSQALRKLFGNFTWHLLGEEQTLPAGEVSFVMLIGFDELTGDLRQTLREQIQTAIDAIGPRCPDGSWFVVPEVHSFETWNAKHGSWARIERGA